MCTVLFDNSGEYINDGAITYEATYADLAGLYYGEMPAIDYINKFRGLQELQSIQLSECESSSQSYVQYYVDCARGYTVRLSILLTTIINITLAKIVGASASEFSMRHMDLSLFENFIWETLAQMHLPGEVCREILTDIEEFDYLCMRPRLSPVTLSKDGYPITWPYVHSSAAAWWQYATSLRKIVPEGGWLMHSGIENNRPLIKWISRMFPTSDDYIPMSHSVLDCNLVKHRMIVDARTYGKISVTEFGRGDIHGGIVYYHGGIDAVAILSALSLATMLNECKI